MIKLGLISLISFLICLNSIHCTVSDSVSRDSVNATDSELIKSEQVLTKQDSSINQTNAKLHRVALKSTHSEPTKLFLPIETISAIESDLKSNQEESIDKIVKEKATVEKNDNPFDKAIPIFIPSPRRSMNNDQIFQGLLNPQFKLRSFFDSWKNPPSPFSKFMSIFDDVLGKTRSAINRPKWRWVFNDNDRQQTKADSTTSESFIKNDGGERFKFHDIPDLPSISDTSDSQKSSQSNSRVEESRYSFNSDTGKAVSVEREMSLFMSDGPDGKKEVIVKQKPPKITIHRIQNPFAIAFQKLGSQNKGKEMKYDDPMKQPSDSNVNEQIPTITMEKHFVGTLDDFFKEISKSFDRSNLFAPSSGLRKASTKSIHQSDGWNFGSDNMDNSDEEDDSPIYVTMNGPLGSMFHRINFNDLDSDINQENEMMMINENKPHSSWSSCLVSMLPLLYLFLVILLLYLIIWLFYTVPTYLGNENSRSRVSRSRSGDNMASPDFLEYRQKIREKLLHFWKVDHSKYNPFGANKQSMPSRQASVSNSSIGGSTLSFPPPYAEALASDPELKNTESVVVVDADSSPKK